MYYNCKLYVTQVVNLSYVIVLLMWQDRGVLSLYTRDFNFVMRKIFFDKVLQDE